MMIAKKITALMLSSLLASSLICSASGEETAAAETTVSQNSALSSDTAYQQYSEKYNGYNHDVEPITLLPQPSDIYGENGSYESDYAASGYPAAVIKENAYLQLGFSVPENGLYAVEIEYWSASDSSGNLEQTIRVDGDVPFEECGYITLSKAWKDTGEKKEDVSGNDIKRPSEEEKMLLKAEITDPSGFVSEPFLFAFSKGEHTFSIYSTVGGIAVKSVTLKAEEKTEKYDEIKAGYDEQGYKEVEGFSPLIVEAEDYSFKSDVTIYPINDRTSYLTTPQSPYKIKLNTVGGSKWKNNGQWISWNFNIEKAGIYKIGFRYKQSLVDGTHVSRTLYIDGEIPFEEAEALEFDYDSKFVTAPVGEGDGFEFYFDEGMHEIKLQVCLGSIGESLGKINESLLNLNAVYRNILMITGSVPDVDRDYGFERLIPDQIDKLEEEYNNLYDTAEYIKGDMGDSSYVSVINKLIYQLKKMYENPRSIAKNLQEFKANLGALSTWLITAREQPLELDKIYIYSGTALEEEPKFDILGKMEFGIKCFISSFVNDYNNIGQSVDFETYKSVTVWVQTGRDQAQILRQLTDNYFSEPEKIRVNIKLVAAGSLLPSTLAGTGPDVALDNAKSDPVNYAIRGANYDLSQFDDFDEVASWFTEDSLSPYIIDSKVFALPQTLSFPMFFYRTDIFEELGLSVPESWDDIISIIPVLQRNNMTMAFPANINGYALLLYKIGGEFYKDGGKESNLNSDKALEAFEEFTELYTLWGLPTEYDFPNRFRTGEMPCGIQDYTMYNNLSAFATEIKGLWDFVPIPVGTDENGNTQTLSIGDGTNVMIMNNAKDVESAWKFVKWWLSEDTQSMYGVEMESILGPAGKHPTANINALFKMSWSGREAQNISEQLKTVRTVPEVPGGYYTTRVIDFAFSRAYNSDDNPSEIIDNYIDELNEELTRKRKEFGYN